MFDNILNQNACKLLKDDIEKNKLPGAILFSGPECSGKLSCALETARVLSCKGEIKGHWECVCPSCLKQKALISQNVLIAGSGNRTLEISASKNTLLSQVYEKSSHIEASRYLFIRAVRKLTSRFSQILWEGEDKLSKFAPLLASIDENLELLSPEKTLPEVEDLKTILDEIESLCDKLESNYLYESIPVSQVRNISAWAHLSSNYGKKVIILENADKMAESSRNALLKILEEPPRDVLFILTTANRTAILPTILSRVRNYSFTERTVEQQQNVISRVFHYNGSYTKKVPDSINLYLQSFLPVTPEALADNAKAFFSSIASGKVPDIVLISNSCKQFQPKILFRIFIEKLIECLKEYNNDASKVSASSNALSEIKRIYNQSTFYNQNSISALEELTRSLMQINYLNDGVFKAEK